MPQALGRLLEASWEVANKVGGIHTVITSKLPLVQATYADRYLAVGPEVGQGDSVFHEASLPADLQEVATRLATQGINFRYGTWNVPGKPAAVLLNWQGMVSNLNQYKSQYWKAFSLDTLGSDFYDVDTPLLWSTAVGIFAKLYAESNPTPLTLQVHEWMAGGALLALHGVTPTNLRTVFTTHATVLGRALSSRGTALNDQLSSIDPTQAAHDLGVTSKHQIEMLAATHADVFTTVSSLTAREAGHLLGRTPDVITENGLSSSTLPDFQTLCLRRAASRRLLDDFTAAYCFPAESFDLNQTTYSFTMGRYEVVNKGYDSYLDSLGALNGQLKAEQSAKTMVAFILVPTGNSPLRGETATLLSLYSRIQAELIRLENTSLPSLHRQHWNRPRPEQLPAPQSSHLTALLELVPNQESTPYSPYALGSGEGITFLELARQAGLHNRPEDRIKVIYSPVYLDGHDGIFNLPLYDLVAGFDLGIFPSRYEPWGYTPLECLAMGVPAVTTDWAGFGEAVQDLGNYEGKSLGGAEVLPRSSDVVQPLTALLKSALTLDGHRLSQQRIGAYLTAQQFTWEQLYHRYTEAYSQAWSK